MIQSIRRKKQVMFELKAETTIAAASVGDDWAQIVILHLDPKTGAVYPIRAKHVPIDTFRHHTPSLSQINAALEKCWRGLRGTTPLDYGRFFLCLPPWCCGSRGDSRTIAIDFDPRIPGLRTPKVTAHHVARLEEMVRQEVARSQSVVVDLIPHHFVLDSGRRLADPVGATTKTLKLEAYLILAEQGTAQGIVDGLADIGIRVDAVMSPWTAAANILAREEKEQGAAVIDVDRRNTCCAFFSEATMEYATRVEGGSADVLEWIGAHLRIPPAAVADCVNEWKEILTPVSWDKTIQRLPLFHWASTHPGLRELDAAAALAAEALSERILQRVVVAQREMMIELKSLVLVGDDMLTLRALQGILADRTGIACRVAMPERVHDVTDVEIRAPARAVGLVREGQALPEHRRVFALPYNRPVLHIMNQRVNTRARQAFWWAVKHFSERAARGFRRNKDKQPLPSAKRTKLLALPRPSVAEPPKRRRPARRYGSLISLLF
ncbi:MAG: hypothetical protein JXR37_07630 [Kiritimatiellae bacterium]|nr:hypothetical protein [Kiritimatiellia bacterium]